MGSIDCHPSNLTRGDAHAMHGMLPFPMKNPLCPLPLAVIALITLMPQTRAAVINFTTNTATTLTGNFSFDIVNDSSGAGQTIANFPHFHLELGSDPYLPGDSQFNIDFSVGSNIVLSGQDLFSAAISASETYDATGEPPSYTDRSGTFLSFFDGTTIAYNYTNVGFTASNIITGNFSYNVVPEPSSTLLIAAAGITLVFKRKR